MQLASGAERPGAPPSAASIGPDERADLLEARGTREYLEKTVRVWLGLRDGSAAVPSPSPHLARLLLRLEEYERPGRDRWGCWDISFSENFQAGRAWKPEIDEWLAVERATLARTTTLEPLWPDGRRFAVCLTHDVDLLNTRSTVQQAVRYAMAGLAPDSATSGGARGRLARPPVRLARSVRLGLARVPSTRDTLERSMTAEADRGVVASYFFTVPPVGHWSRYDCVYAPTDPCLFRGTRVRIVDVMHALAGEGFDVGLHGSYRAALEPGALSAEREALELATGLRITTTRQHFLRWDVRSTPTFQEEARLVADSSLGFNRNVGFRAGTSFPFHHYDVAGARTLGLLEVPLVIQDGALLRRDGLDFDLVHARRVLRALIDSVAAGGGVVTLLFHPDKFVRPDWLALYEWALDYGLERQGWLTSLSRLDEWWRGREARVLAG